MPMTPAEELEARRAAGEGMQVPIQARPSLTYLIEGEALPTKVAVCSTDCPAEVLLSIANRNLGCGSNLSYLRARRVHQGMVALDARPLQSGDMVSCSQAGMTIRDGELEAGETFPPGDVVAAQGEPPEETYAWRVVDTEGNSFLLTLPAPADSFDLADSIAAHMHGAFHIERVDTGSMTVAADMSAPGWNLEVEPAPAPRLAPRIGGLRRF